MNIGFKGKFQVVKKQVLMDGDVPKLDANGCQIVVSEDLCAEFDNLITNSGLNRIGTGSALDYCYLSSDNSEPSITDSSVLGFLASATVSSSADAGNSTTGDVYFSLSKTYSFGAGVGTGNISKLGIGWNSGGNGLWSIQLIKDSEGNPTVISKLDYEILEITYILTTHIDSVDYTGVVNISGIDHDVIVRPSQISRWRTKEPDVLVASPYECFFYTGDITDIDSYPGGTVLGFSRSIARSYIDQSYEYKYIISADIATGNSPLGIKSIRISANNINRISYQAQFDPPIMKTSEQTLKLPPFFITWGRYVSP